MSNTRNNVRDDLGTDRKQGDPQVVLSGMLRESENSNIIVFTLPLALLEITFIVTVPEKGTTIAPVYCKFRVPRR
jgi:hypothetical protein